MGNTTGCTGNFLIILGVFVIGFLSYFANTIPTRTITQTQYPFIFSEKGISYFSVETINCQHGISGNIVFIDSTTNHDNIGLMLQRTDEGEQRTEPIPGWIDSSTGNFKWDVLLKGEYWYYFWVYDKNSLEPLSSQVLVDRLDCVENINAQFDFREDFSSR